MKCTWHLCENVIPDNNKRKFCSNGCKSKFYVTKRRKDIKAMAVEYKGGKCEYCGYGRCIEALEFHHIDPTKKDFAISSKGDTRSWKRVREELDKCVMLCANCHREEEAK